MIYFQKIELQDISQGLVEKKIRESSFKRHSSLDLLSSSTYVNEEKHFLGIESDKFINIIRIRTPFERLLPRIIVRFDKDDFSFYKIRLSLLSFLISIFLSTAIVLNIMYSIINGHLESDILSVFAISLIYLLLIMIEIKLTKREINKTIKNKI
jgi:hypothetical protein